MLVIVLISLFAFGCEFQAKSDQSIDRNRRDAQSFYDQLEAASKLDESCNQSSCATLAKHNVCPGFCKRNETLIIEALPAISKCLSTYPCNLNMWNLNQVKIPLTFEGYDGVCSLSGNVTVSDGSDVEFIGAEYNERYSTSFPSYKLYSRFTITYSGLSVTCSPCTSLSGGSGNELKLNLKSLELDTRADKGGSKFSASVTVTQQYLVDFVSVFFTSVTYLTGCFVTTSVKLGSGVPAEYEKQVGAVVKIQLNDFDLINNVCINYASNAGRALKATFNTTCLQANC